MSSMRLFFKVFNIYVAIFSPSRSSSFVYFSVLIFCHAQSVNFIYSFIYLFINFYFYFMCDYIIDLRILSFLLTEHFHTSFINFIIYVFNVYFNPVSLGLGLM